MKRLKIVCLLGLLMSVAACSSSNPTSAADPADTANNASANNPSSADSPEIQADDSKAPILSVDNYASFAGFSLNFFATRVLPGPFVSNPAPQDFTQPESTMVDPSTGREVSSFTCTNGGTATRTDNTPAEPIFSFTDCQINDSVLNGQLSVIAGKYAYNREFTNYSADINGGTSIHSVTSGEILNRSGNVCGRTSRSRAIEQYTITQGEQVFELKEWRTNFDQIRPAADLCDTDMLEISGQYSIRSTETGNNDLQVNITETVTGTSLTPTAGEITITASDASTVAINFATGDEATVRVSITNNNGENIFEEPLSSWIDSLLLP